MNATEWTDEDTARAMKFWDDYQAAHDVSSLRGQTAGIDPETGRVWFGESLADIVDQMEALGARRPLYFVRIGKDYYYRKGGRR